MSEETRWIDRPGIFRGTPVEIAMKDSEQSSSVALHVTMTIDEWLNQETKQWEDWRSYNFRATGDLWIIGKTGGINETAAEMARDVLGWDGNMENPDVGRLNPCQFSVNQEEYKGKYQHKIGFFNAWDFVPGPRVADPAKVKQMQSQHGSALRAFFGQKQTKTPPPAGKPTSPPPPAPPKAPPYMPPSPSLGSKATTHDAAWKEVVAAYKGDESLAHDHWMTAYSKVAGSKEPDHVTPGEWSRITDEACIPI